MQSNLQNNDSVNDVGYFMVAVTALIKNTISNKFLILRRPNKMSWVLPSGRMSQGEEILECLKREVFEETAIDKVTVKKLIGVWHSYRGEKIPSNELVGISYYCETDISEVKISFEHCEYKWVSREEAKILLKPEIYNLLSQID